MNQKPGFIAGFLIYLNLFAFAVAFPVLDLISRNSEFLVVRRSTPFEILILPLVLLFVGPLILIILEKTLYKASDAIGKIFRNGAICALSFATFLIILNRAPLTPGFIAVICALALAGLATFFISKNGKFTGFITWLLPFVIYTLFNFYFNPNVKSLLNTKEEKVKEQAALQGSSTPVVLIVFDEFPLWALLNRELKIDEKRFPNFAKLAAKSHWFKNATSVNQFTPLAVPAILSGRFPQVKPVLPTYNNYKGNLFTLLQNSHQLFVKEPITRLCPQKICGKQKAEKNKKQNFSAMLMDVLAIYLRSLIPEDIDLGQPEIEGKWKDFWGDAGNGNWTMPQFSRDNRIKDLRVYISGIKKTAKPAFYFSHNILPHMPLQFLPSGRSYTLAGMRGYSKDRWTDDPAILKAALRQYILQVGTVDTLLGEFISKLEEEKIFDEALFILTADHGFSIEPNTFRRGNSEHPAFYEDILQIPMFIKLPHQQEGVVNERNVETIDVLPTIADVLKIEPPFAVDGQSAFRDPAREKKRVMLGRIPRAKVKGLMPDGEEMPEGQEYILDLPKEFPRASLERKLSQPSFEKVPASDPFYVGYFPELLGKKISEFKTEKSPNLTLRMDAKSWHRGDKIIAKWQADGETCPCRIMGKIKTTSDMSRSMLAVSVNGVIRGFNHPFINSSNSAIFEFFVNEKALKDGENTFNIWQVELKDEKITSLTEISPAL